ncbi:MAG: protein-L-isoaspartate(D-aspartate) O-methyltransferase [bacterium]|nr:protein-L-isoaspartate(D-aspartate) O-methyltransferase [bacterium]
MKMTKEDRFFKERERMVREQIIGRGIKDERLIEAMKKVPRHKFVEEALESQAYGDHPLPIGFSQTISQPYMVALMTEGLCLQGTERVLEIGTGSGYQTAILAELAEKVFTVERVKQLADRAERLLRELRYKNIVVMVNDGSAGLPQFAPFDRIIVTAAAPTIPQVLLEQLVDSGIVVIPKGDRFSQDLLIVEKRGGKIYTTSKGGCVFVPLIGKFGWKENEVWDL